MADHIVLFGLTFADPTIPWPPRGSGDITLIDREGWTRRAIPVLCAGRATFMEAACCGELAVNVMLEGDDGATGNGIAICLADSGWRISWNGGVFQRCEAAMRAAEEMARAHGNWSSCRVTGFTDEQRRILRQVHEGAMRRGEIMLDQVFPT